MKRSYVHEPKGLILLKCPHYPSKIQTEHNLSEYEWHSLQSNTKSCKTRKTPNTQMNYEWKEKSYRYHKIDLKPHCKAIVYRRADYHQNQCRLMTQQRTQKLIPAYSNWFSTNMLRTCGWERTPPPSKMLWERWCIR